MGVLRGLRPGFGPPVLLCLRAGGGPGAVGPRGGDVAAAVGRGLVRLVPVVAPRSAGVPAVPRFGPDALHPSRPPGPGPGRGLALLPPLGPGEGPGGTRGPVLPAPVVAPAAVGTPAVARVSPGAGVPGGVQDLAGVGTGLGSGPLPPGGTVSLGRFRSGGVVPLGTPGCSRGRGVLCRHMHCKFAVGSFGRDAPGSDIWYTPRCPLSRGLLGSVLPGCLGSSGAGWLGPLGQNARAGPTLPPPGGTSCEGDSSGRGGVRRRPVSPPPLNPLCPSMLLLPELSFVSCP